MTFKPSQLLILFCFPILASAQSHDTIVLDQLFHWEETIFDFSAPPFETLVDTLNNKPINGWVRIQRRRNLLFRHYQNGLKDGYSVAYKKRRNKYRLRQTRFYSNGSIVKSAKFSPRRQYSDSTSYSWGLKSYTIWFPDSSDHELIFREIKNVDRNKVVDHSYFPESNMKLRTSYKTRNPDILLKKQINDMGQKHFPYELNENQDAFSFVRYDGYYYCLRCLNETPFFIRFYPNGTAKIKRNSEPALSIQEGKSLNGSTYNVDFRNDMNVPGMFFEINETEVKIRGTIEPATLFLEIQSYGYGPYFRYPLFFSVDD